MCSTSYLLTWLILVVSIPFSVQLTTVYNKQDTSSWDEHLKYVNDEEITETTLSTTQVHLSDTTLKNMCSVGPGCSWNEDGLKTLTCERLNTFPDCFPGDVERINLSGDFDIPENGFRNLDSLRFIEITSRSIQNIATASFNDLQSIIKIELRGEGQDERLLIANINTGAFSNINFQDNVSDGLVLKYCQIGTIEKEIMDNITGLIHIQIRNTLIRNVELDAFSGLKNIRSFIIDKVIIENEKLRLFDNGSVVSFQLTNSDIKTLSSSLLPTEGNSLLVKGNVFTTLEENFQCDPIPPSNEWHDNIVICECELEWIYSEDSCIKENVIDSFTCKLQKRKLSIFSLSNPLLCQGQKRRSTVTIIVAIVISCLGIIILALLYALYKMKKKRSKRDDEHRMTNRTSGEHNQGVLFSNRPPDILHRMQTSVSSSHRSVDLAPSPRSPAYRQTSYDHIYNEPLTPGVQETFAEKGLICRAPTLPEPRAVNSTDHDYLPIDDFCQYDFPKPLV